ncbi:MAG TPA: response regulator transcription factor [Acholeplasmataceae bacterium]|nr:response regulator transcription factor [Acholeplasmataceae bacterium]
MLVFFVEDDKSISYVIQKTLEKLGLKTEGFHTGESFLKRYYEEKPTLILLDIMLPDTSGLDLLKEIREDDSEIPIIIISALFNEMDKVIALDLGADDYITKPFGILELTSRIQARLRKVSVDKSIKFADLSVDVKQFKVFSNNEEIYFTKKEFEILVYLLSNKDEVLPKEKIFLDVWKTSFMGETRALDMHVKSIRRKLEDAKSQVLIETVYGVGYKIGIV